MVAALVRNTNLIKNKSSYEKFSRISNVVQYVHRRNIPENVLNDEWFKLRYTEDKYPTQKIPETLIGIKGIEVGVFMNVKQQLKNFTNEHELYYIDHSYILVKVEGHERIYQLMCYKYKYSLYPMYKDVNILTKNVNHYQRSEALKELKEPNNIGVFTFSKLKAHAEYCDKMMEVFKRLNEGNNNKKEENLKIVNDFISNTKNAIVQKSNDGNSFWIDTPNFSIKLELQDNGRYLSKNITYKGNLDRISEIESKF